MMRAILIALLCTAAQAQVPAPWEPAAKQVAWGEAGGAYWAVWWYRHPQDRHEPWRRDYALCAVAGCADRASKLLAAKDFAGLRAMRDTPASDPRFAAAMVQVRAQKPPAGPWVVAKNGATATRPTRRLNVTDLGLALGESLTLRVPVDARCMCQFRVAAASATWCLVAAQNKVPAAAVCTEVSPP